MSTQSSDNVNQQIIDNKIETILANENKIKEELQKENNELRKIITNQKDAFEKQEQILTDQIKDHLKKLEPLIAKINQRLDKLESGNVSITISTKDIAQGIEHYYRESISNHSLKIATLNQELLEYNNKKKEYEKLQKELEDTKKCIESETNPIVLKCIKSTVSDMESKFSTYNLESISSSIKRIEEELLVSNKELERIKKYQP